jgi:L-alanine-DL-glutamate epimerase-like enolase superfamily enzyme
MEGEQSPIEAVRARALRVPTDGPESDGTYEWTHTVLVLVEATAAGKTGIGYTYADRATASVVNDQLAPVVTGLRPATAGLAYRRMLQAVRNLGREGIAAMAISAVDLALWDLRGKIAGTCVASLLGATREAVDVYGSGGFTSYSNDRLAAQLGAWASSGMKRVKMKVGRDRRADRERVRVARQAIGPDVELFVDGNGAYTRRQALAEADAFAREGVTWFEEPVTSEDLQGLRWLRETIAAPMDVAAGEYGFTPSYFKRMLEAQAVDVLQADATRCGGATGFDAADALCDATPLPLSCHCAPQVHAHLACASRRVVHLEYFHDHARIESMLFDGALLPHDGKLRPDRSRPGFGIELRAREAEKYAV